MSQISGGNISLSGGNSTTGYTPSDSLQRYVTSSNGPVADRLAWGGSAPAVDLQKKQAELDDLVRKSQGGGQGGGSSGSS